MNQDDTVLSRLQEGRTGNRRRWWLYRLIPAQRVEALADRESSQLQRNCLPISV